MPALSLERKGQHARFLKRKMEDQPGERHSQVQTFQVKTMGGA